jgi:hypothetical protein
MFGKRRLVELFSTNRQFNPKQIGYSTFLKELTKKRVFLEVANALLIRSESPIFAIFSPKSPFFRA